MMKQYLGHVWASLLLLGGTTEIYADTNLPASSTRIQRSFVNLSFENILSGATPNLNACPNRTTGASWSSSYCLFDQKWIEGWKTTASFFDNNNVNLGHREIELWKGNGTSSAPNAKAGNLYAELNAHTVSTLYQNICVTKDDSFSWSLWHMARSNATSERISFIIADEIKDLGGSAPITPTGINALKNQVDVTEFGSTATGSWTRHYNDTPVQLSAYLNGATAKVKAFGFQAKGGSSTNGNWLDNIEVKLKPAIEFSADNGTVLENATGTNHSVDFNIVGLVNADFDVAFIIDNTAVSNPAVYGTDYKIFDNSSGTPVEIVPAVTADPKKLSFKYKVRYNSSLNYSAGVKVTGLVIQVINNNNKEGKKQIPFMLDKSQTGIAVMDLSQCGGDVFDGFIYAVEDDDVDLSITKKMNETSPLPGTAVSYEMTLFNDSKTTAKNVKLFDTLGANLAATANTELTCKLVDANGAEMAPSCDTILTSFQTGNAKTWASQFLNTTGLAIGDVPANQYFKFTLTNLMISTTDKETVQANKNYIINNAEVRTDSTDQNAANNTAVAKTMYAAKNDLYNNDSTNTGKNPFVVNNSGTPLWTQNADASSKAYFPLVIKNEATVAQDYQLYNSSAEIKPVTNPPGNYSLLEKATITPFTAGLKVEFYKAEIGQCKAGISSQQITQLNIAANTTGQVCAVITAYSSVVAKTNIWFAIESLQSGLGDIILDAIIPQPQKRLLELSNDQTAQVGVGGSYVFLHRLTNYGVENETKVKVGLSSTNNNGFLYTLFLDQNGNSTLDASDTLLSAAETELSNIIEPNKSVTLFIKVEAPATATNGMTSQVRLIAKPDNTGKAVTLADLSNTDLITVSPSQLQILKSQFKVASCSMANAQAVINSTYTVQNESLKPSQCLIYRIMVKNSGSETLSNVIINDMYPAYTKQWASTNILPIVGSNGQNITDSSNNKIEDDQVAKIRAILKELLPQQEKSLYFGIKMN